MQKALTERLKNPLAIKHFDFNNWVGLDGYHVTGDGRKFCRFKTVAHGIRAAVRVLWRYEDRNVPMTPKGIVYEWTATDDAAYLERVLHLTGFGAEDKIDTGDTKQLYTLLKAMQMVEAGYDWVKPGDWHKGFEMVGLKLRPAAASKRLIGGSIASLGVAATQAQEQFSLFQGVLPDNIVSIAATGLLGVGLLVVFGSWYFDRVR